jgi:hypothetical protein
MSNKFENVPVEPDTHILFRLEATLGEYDVLYEKWSWEGILGESLIFAGDDLANLNDDEIENICRTSPLLKEETDITIKRSTSNYVFINFNFEIS